MSLLKQDTKISLSLYESLDIDRLAPNVEVDMRPAPSNLIHGIYQLGWVDVDGRGPGNALLVDQNYNFDVKWARGEKFVARIENPLTKISGGHISNASIVKLDLISGKIHFVTDKGVENDEPIWDRGKKFKRAVMVLAKMKELGWVR